VAPSFARPNATLTLTRLMEFLKILSLRGPNIWASRPVLEVWLDIGVLEDAPFQTIPGFYERLTDWLPSLVEPRCGMAERGGFLQQLREGTWSGHILEHVTIELQNLAGMQTGFGKTLGTPVRGVYKVMVPSRNEQVSRAALHAARDLILAAMNNQPYDVAATLTKLHVLVDTLCLGPSTACIVDAATDRCIPSIRLTEGNLVQLGYGARQHRIWTAESDRVSAIAESISKDKTLTKTFLQAYGVPVPVGRIVTSPEDAWKAAEEIGVPVVVKPSDGNHGCGVSTELMTREEVETAYAFAIEQGREVIVERFIRGNEHRLLMVGGRLVAAIRGESVSLLADGCSSIRKLIAEQINTDPRRGIGEDFPLSLVDLDDDEASLFEICRQGYTPDSIPSSGSQVWIQRNGNMMDDVTDLVHPEVVSLVAFAVHLIGLDIAGVDLVAEDISRPLAEQDGAIIEINAGPGLLMHLKPGSGQPRPVGRAIVDSLFSDHEDGRIPVIGICGTHGKAQVARIVAGLLKLAGLHVGIASRDGLSFDKRVVDKNDCANRTSAQKVLINRSVEAAVLENSVEMILSEGLGYDRCQVGIVTNIEPARHFGRYFLETDEQVCNVLRTQIDVVLREGVAVLNGSDPLVVELARHCAGAVIFFAATDPLPAVTEHLNLGGRAVLVRDGGIVLSQGGMDRVVLMFAEMPMASKGCNQAQLENILAAVAATWALGVSMEIIRAGIATLEVELTDASVR
jgi:cyanophycin synthetase